MLQQKEQLKTQSNWRDGDTFYGWMSIGLHWLTAIVIIALWFIGKAITKSSPDAIDATRALHVSIASAAWLFILLRIIWRARSGHPHVNGQSQLVHRIAMIDHYAMLVAVSLMLLSGPVMVWSTGNPINVFGWLTIPGPFGPSESRRELAMLIHASSAMILLWLVLLHIAGALKHLMFHSDDTIARMLWPGRRNPESNR